MKTAIGKLSGLAKHSTDPGTDIDPCGHVLQLIDPGDEYVPAGHGVHWFVEFNPVMLEKVPSGQGVG